MSTFAPAAGAQSAAGPRGWLRNPVAPSATISGVLFDVDGTLYDQGRLRAFMAAELAAAPLWTGAGARHRAGACSAPTARRRNGCDSTAPPVRPWPRTRYEKPRWQEASAKLHSPHAGSRSGCACGH